MPKNLTDPAKAADLIDQSYDPDYVCGLHLDMRRAWGEPEDELAKLRWEDDDGYGDGLIRFDDVRSNSFDIGKSPVMMVASNLMVSRFASQEPSFTFDGAKKWQQELRKAIVIARMRDSGGPLESFEEDAKAFDDGDSLGIGSTKQMLVEDRVSGKRKWTSQHVPCTQTVWDPWHASPVRSRWRCDWNYVSPEEAASVFGWKEVNKPGVIQVDTHESRHKQARESVRILEWYDLGYGESGDPTYMVWLGNFNGKYVERFENPFGRLPYADVVNFVKPGMMRPTGRVFMERQDAEMLTALYKFVKTIAMEGRTMDILYEMDIVPGDLDAWLAGLQRFVRSKGKPDKPPYYRIPGDQVPPDIWNMIASYERKFGQGQLDADLDLQGGGSSSESATKTAEKANRLNQNMSWTTSMMAHYRHRQIQCMIDVMRVGDRHPTTINMWDSQVTVNQPGVPTSYLSNLLSGEFEILIDRKAMTVEEDRLMAAFQLTQLEKIREFDPVWQFVSPEWWWDEYLKTGGKYDKSAALQQATPATAAIPGAGIVPAAPAQTQAVAPGLRAAS